MKPQGKRQRDRRRDDDPDATVRYPHLEKALQQIEDAPGPPLTKADRAKALRAARQRGRIGQAFKKS